MSRAMHDLAVLYGSAKEERDLARLQTIKAEIAELDEQNAILLSALKFFSNEPVAAQALAKYNEIKRRAQDVTKPL